MSRPSWDDYFLGIAAAVAARADCTRRQVGAVLVLNRRILSTGYNGAPAGEPGCASAGACPRGRFTHDEVPVNLGNAGHPVPCIAVHAEDNALRYARRHPANDYQEDRTITMGTTMYITDEPCPGCYAELAKAGVIHAVWPGGST